MIKLTARTQFPRTQRVFVIVEPVRFFPCQRRIGISLPAAAQIEHIVNAFHGVASRDAESHHVILSIADIREAQAPGNTRKESPRSAHSVYAQKIVRPVIVSPFPVIYDTRRNGFEIKIRKFI